MLKTAFVAKCKRKSVIHLELVKIKGNIWATSSSIRNVGYKKVGGRQGMLEKTWYNMLNLITYTYNEDKCQQGIIFIWNSYKYSISVCSYNWTGMCEGREPYWSSRNALVSISNQLATWNGSNYSLLLLSKVMLHIVR